jgi:hypothetical protein
MGIIGYDPNNLSGYGSIFAPERELSNSFRLSENISADLSEIPSLNELEQVFINGWITPVINVSTNVNDLPFISTPEPRYKLGTYSYGSGLVITRNPPEPPVIETIRGTPFFIVYPRQTLHVGRFCFLYPGTTQDDFEIVFDFNLSPQLDVWILNGRSNASNSPTNNLATTFFIDVPPGILMDVKLYYSFQVTALQYFADDRDRQPVLI